jgi:hypothetical protein
MLHTNPDLRQLTPAVHRKVPERRRNGVPSANLEEQVPPRLGVHRGTRALEAAIREYLTTSNGSAKPFVWTKTADEIVAKVAGFCQRISNSGH